MATRSGLDEPALALELLVHGVGGTTPEEMLNDPRIVRLQGDDTAGIYRRVDDADAEGRPADYRGKAVAEAYSWANMTSGNGSRALWLLLLPFMVANLVHWMRPPAGEVRHRRLERAYDLLVRLTALSLTVLLVAAACEVSMDLVAWQCAGAPGCAQGKSWLGFLSAGRGGWWSLPGRRLAVAAAVPLAITGLLWWLSHRTWIAYESQRPALPGQAPNGASGRPGQHALSLPGFWYGRRLVARLRAAHTAAGFLTVGAALLLPALWQDRAAGADLLQGLGWGIAFVLGLLSTAVLFVAGGSGRSEEAVDEVVDRLAVRWLPAFALGGAVLAALYACVGRDGWRSAGWIPGGDVFTWIAVVQGSLSVLLALVAGWMHRANPHGRTVLRGLGGPAVAVIACALGGLMAAGAAQRVADWLDRGTTPGREHGPLTGPPVVLIWQAAAIPAVLLVLLGLLLVVGVRYWRTRARLIQQVQGGLRGELEQPARTRQIAAAHARAGLTDLAPALVATTAVATFLLGTAAVLGSLATGKIPGDAARGTPAVVAAVAQIAQALGSWLIGAAVVLLVTLGRRAYKSASARRTVGILWDVGTFWPRAAHPFAPPCYAERAVPDLTWRMATWAAGSGRKLVLSGHSQGSVLAAAAAWQLDTPTRSKVALLTYGSPLARLYARYFPAYLGPDALASLHGELQAWKNLWRRTDPIGGPVLVTPAGAAPPVDAEPLPDPAAYGRSVEHPLPAPILGHHEYREEPAFAVVRAGLLERLLPSEGEPVVPVPVPAQAAEAATEGDGREKDCQGSVGRSSA